MKTVGFIGAYDKTDLITYIAKILVTMGKSVLVIDATTLQKAKYVVPTISPAKSYVTEYEDMDIAVGFYNYASIKEYLGMPQHAVFTYDYIFLDIDSPESLENFDIKTANKNYFVSGFDVYSLKRGLEILSGIKEPMPLTKEEDEYFDYIALGYKVIWDEERVYFPFEQGDQTIIMENQRVSKIKFRKLTQLYRESLLYIAEEILDNPKETGEIRKAFKKLEKGV